MPHYDRVDPAKEWQAGFVGFITRLRGVASTIGLGGLSTGASYLGGYYPLAIVIAATTLVVGGSLFWTRRYFLRRIKSEDRLHAFHHDARDILAEIVECTDNRERLAIVEKFNKQAAQRIADFFSIRCGDETINCAIRLAQSDSAGGPDLYVTRARSTGMDIGRQGASAPVKADEGIARAMLGRKQRGAYIIPSIEEAVKENIWVENPNDKCTDVRTLMVAPINGWRGGQMYMLGILFVTSAKMKSSTFSSVDSLPLKAFADSLGLAYAAIWDKIS